MCQFRQIFLGAALLGAGSSNATVTWQGTEGVNTSVFAPSCATSSCHDSTASGGIRLDSYTNFENSDPALTTDPAITSIVNRINGIGTLMPSGGPALHDDLISLIEAWRDDGTPFTANAEVSTLSETNVQKYQATFRGQVKENGVSTSFRFRYNTVNNSSSGYSITSSTNADGTGGDDVWRPVTNVTQTGMDCGETYYVWLVANSNGNTVGDLEIVDTDACHSISSNPTDTVDEDNLYSHSLVIANDGGLSMTYSLLNAPEGMSVNSSGLITWTPGNGTTTSGIVTARAYDGTTIATRNFTVTVNPVNDPPSITSTAGTLAVEDQTYTYTATVSDVDDDNNGSDLSWSLTNEPTGMVVSSTGVVTWTPENGVATSGTVTLTVSDGEFNDTEDFTVSASAVNDAPEILSTPSSTNVLEDNPYSYAIATRDIDGDDVTLSIASGTSGDMRIEGGRLLWTPLEGETDADVRIVASDSLLEDSQSFTITVTPVNDAPVINTTTLDSGLETLEYTALLDITDDDHTIGQLTLSLLNEPAGMVIEASASQRSLVWTPPEGTRTSGTFTLSVDDGDADPVTQDFEIVVEEYNTPPAIISAAPVTATEDVGYQYLVEVDDLDDQTPETDLTFSLTNAPDGMEVDTSGLITWTPLEGATTSGTVTVSVADGGEDDAAPATEDFTIAVTQVNDAPVITSSAPAEVIEINLYSYQLTITDPDDANDGSGALSFSLSGEPAGMTISDTGFIEWVPPEGTRTSGAFTISVADGGEDNVSPASEAVTIEVIEFNTPPAITSIAGTLATEDIEYTYQLVIEDIDDPNDGSGALAFSLQNNPEGMEISDTGLISWTPLEEVTTSDEVTVVVTDGGEDAAAPATENFTVAVVRVNDAPEITSTAPNTVVEDETYVYQVGLSDPDDVNNGVDIAFELSNQPEGMAISRLGLITWPTDENSPASSTITVTVMDGGEDDALPATETFTVSVNFDVDGDGVLNDLDNCRTVANDDQADNEEDGVGDVCDADDDNDGMTDEFEEANGLDPFDPSDAEEDSDGDGVSNQEEFENGGDPNVDDTPPSITPPLNLRVNSTGFETYVELGSAIATDSLNGPLATTSDLPSGAFRPGRHIVTWAATDELGNTSTAEQVVDVIPQISIETSRSAEEGQTVNVVVSLNGDPVRYPVTVDYLVGGTADSTDHNLTSGSLTLEGPSEILSFDIADDETAEGEETIEITLIAPSGAVLSRGDTHVLTIVEDNVAPIVSLSVLQDSVPGLIVNREDGLVIIDSEVTDPNTDETFTYDWSATDNALASQVGLAQSRFIFDPLSVVSGIYKVEVEVTDSRDAAVTQNIVIQLVETFVADTDANGIDDSIDNTNEPFTLLTDSDEDTFIETQPGLSLQLGETAVRAGANGSEISLEELETLGNEGSPVDVDTEFEFDGGLFDFVVSGLSQRGQSITVVLPQLVPIPENAQYRKFINGDWQDFVEDANNSVASASSVEGVCPAPASGDYVLGLIEGDDCVQLRIEDGGPNDADGEANGVVRDPGGVGISTGVVSGGGSSSSGGGSMGIYTLILVLALGLLRRRKYVVEK